MDKHSILLGTHYIRSAKTVTFNDKYNTTLFIHNIIYYKMLSYRRQTALQGALQFSPKVEDWN